MKPIVFLLLAALGAAPAAAPAQTQKVDTTAEGQAAAQACGFERDITEDEFRALAPAKRMQFLACLQRQAAASMQKQLPTKVDDVTTLRSITAKDAEVTYDYTVDVDASAVTAEQKQSIDQRIRQNVCAAADMSAVIRAGGSYAYRWEDRKAIPIYQLTVRSC